jgi:hypothetical protein
VGVVGVEVAVREPAAVDVEEEPHGNGRPVEPAGHAARVDLADLGDVLAPLRRRAGRVLRPGLRDRGPVLVGHRGNHAVHPVRLRRDSPPRKAPM